MVKSGSARRQESAAAATQRARIVHEYDKIIAEFGEDPFRPGAVSQRADGLGKVMEEIGASDPKRRHELLKQVTEKSVRCAELIEKALSAADKFKAMDAKLKTAMDEYEMGVDAVGDDDEDEDVDMDDEEGAATAIMLGDLITASEELQQAGKQLAQVGIVAKSTQASRALLSSTDQTLNAALGGITPAAEAAINDEFRDLYAEEFTSAFGDDLDRFRQEDRFESKDVNYLISCIHAGGDIFTPLQKKLFVESARGSNGNA
ncbi:hypothetical protein Poli38472_012845 [Pythium oligandrum]|uniref:Ribosome assembly protein 3 n=1 Tax=Pythium oligandrum TaxID=41045 RepID=A0A8K1CKW1_PYTOL|nr:hypothetical protein Poli38472_012845 [Pythium oligandrum]|eukprot:TMW64223.1 hypothetical protein Poli38472_012845 [Pythium oligandrum]